MNPDKQPDDVQGVPTPPDEAVAGGAEAGAEPPPTASPGEAGATAGNPGGVRTGPRPAGTFPSSSAAPPEEEDREDEADGSEGSAAIGEAPPGAGPAAGSARSTGEKRPRHMAEVRPIHFSAVEDRAVERDSASLDLLMDIRLPVTVELGRTQAFVRDILEYGPGTVVELDKLAGDPVDILVNGKLVAQGEVVVIDDHFGVRVNVLLSPRERVRSLGG